MTTKNYDPSTDKEYMSTEMVNYFKDVLLTESAVLNRQIHANHEVATQLNSEVDPIDQASVESERSLGAVNRDRDIQKLKAIKQAVFKIASDDYGFCDQCGDEIGTKRLLFNPALPLCFDCADIKERKAHQYAK